MKVLSLVVCLAIFIAGCGSGSTANNVVMQGGQWEYVVTPENGVDYYASRCEFAGNECTVIRDKCHRFFCRRRSSL